MKYKDELFNPLTDRVGYKLIIALTNKFHSLLINIGRIKPVRYTYITRPLISKSKQYFESDVLNVFIDSIIEIWEKLLLDDFSVAELIVRQWEQIDEPFFNRLTLYGLKRLLELDHVR